MKYTEKESNVVEWEQEIPKNDQIINTIIGFCNRYGGKVVIGVDDNGDILGVDEDLTEELLEHLDKRIYELTTPPILPVIYTRIYDNKTLVFVEVSSGMNKPYYKRTEGIEKGTYIRLGRNTMRATMDMIEELKWQSRGRSYEEMPVYNASKEYIDYQKVRDFLKRRKKAMDIQINDALLQNYSVIVSEHGKEYPSVLGLLLFGHEPEKYFPEAMILCSHFSGVQGRDAIANRDCHGTLFEQFHAAYDFILGRLNYSFKIESAVREEEYEIPAIAIREALLNAIIHRNYHVNAPIKIAIFDNRIEFNSPGSFPGPIDTNQISLGISYLRNSMICRIFREAGYIEKLGSGLPTIFLNFKKHALTEPTIYENGNYVKCILPRTKISPELTGKNDDDLTDILKLFSLTNEISISDVMDHFSLTRATAGRRLNSLVEKGLIERIGKGKNIRYALIRK